MLLSWKLSLLFSKIFFKFYKQMKIIVTQISLESPIELLIRFNRLQEKLTNAWIDYHNNPTPQKEAEIDLLSECLQDCKEELNFVLDDLT